MGKTRSRKGFRGTAPLASERALSIQDRRSLTELASLRSRCCPLQGRTARSACHAVQSRPQWTFSLRATCRARGISFGLNLAVDRRVAANAKSGLDA